MEYYTAPSWVTVTPSSGTGTTQCTVTVSANTGSAKSGNITATLSGAVGSPSSQPINQSGVQCTLSTSKTYPDPIPASGNTYSNSFTVNVTGSNCGTWSITSPSWLTVTPSSGTGTTQCTVTVSANTGSTRSGNITVTLSGAVGSPSSQQINQAPVQQCTLSTSKTYPDLIPASGGTYSNSLIITVTGTNCGTWTVTNKPSWVTSVTPLSGTGTQQCTVTVASNSGTSRSGNIEVTLPGATGSPGSVPINQAPPPTNICITLPDTLANANSSIEIPINVCNTTNQNIISYQFTLTFNSPNSFLTATGYEKTGTLSASWQVVSNTSVPNQITVSAMNVDPLIGSGILLKLKFDVSSSASSGHSSNLTFSSFTFNAGSPLAATTNGKITIQSCVCGDVDKNGMIQAYDAALVLRHSANIPPLLSTDVQPCADVDGNGSIQAFDAAQILRKSAGLSPTVSTCFGSGPSGITRNNEQPLLKFKLGQILFDAGKPYSLLKFEGIESDMGIIAFSFDINVDGKNVENLEFFNLPNEYLYAINRIDQNNFRVAIISSYGIESSDLMIAFKLLSKKQVSSLMLENIMINNMNYTEITLSKTPINNVVVIPSKFDLIGAYPNPFNPSTNILFDIPVEARVIIEIYGLQGNKIRTLTNDLYGEGRYQIIWDSKNDFNNDVPSGIYFCTMKSQDYFKTIKLVLVK